MISCGKTLKDDSCYMTDYKCWNSDSMIAVDSYEEEKRHISKEKMVPYKGGKLGFPNDMLKDGSSRYLWKNAEGTWLL